MRDKEKRVLKSPRKYAYANLIAFALIAVHEIETNKQKLIQRLLGVTSQKNGGKLWIRKCNLW